MTGEPMGNAAPECLCTASYDAFEVKKPVLKPIAWYDRHSDDEDTIESALNGEFRMILHSCPAELGFEIDISDGSSLVIADVHSPDMLSTPSGNCLESHDRIVEANGVSGDAAAMLNALFGAESWDLVVQRPMEFLVKIDRRDRPSLGMDLLYASNGVSLMVDSVGDGVIRAWNEASPAFQIQRCDRICEVNGVRGAAVDLMSAMVDKDILLMSVLKYTSMPMYSESSA